MYSKRMHRKLRIPFRVIRHGSPIRKVHIRREVNSGIAVASPMRGVVPEFETREAAIYCGHKLNEWDDLDYWERCLAVAQYRMHNLIEAHVSDAVKRNGTSARNPANRGRSRTNRHA